MAKIDFIASEFGANIVAALLQEQGSEQSFGAIAGAEALISAAKSDTGFLSRLDTRTQSQDDHVRYIAPIFKTFIKHTDPSPNAKYAEWISLAYISRIQKKTPFKAEDLYKIRDDLKDFELLREQLKANGKSVDINSYKNYDALVTTLHPLQAKRASAIGLSLPQALKETTIIYDGPAGKIVMPHTMEASRYWGTRTKWCIAADDRNQNMFNIYNEKSPVFIYLPNANDADRAAIPDYESFKYCFTGGVFYDELDNQSDAANAKKPVPRQFSDALIRLKEEAFSALDPSLVSYLTLLAWPKDKTATMPPPPLQKPEDQWDEFDKIYETVRLDPGKAEDILYGAKERLFAWEDAVHQYTSDLTSDHVYDSTLDAKTDEEIGGEDEAKIRAFSNKRLDQELSRYGQCLAACAAAFPELMENEDYFNIRDLGAFKGDSLLEDHPEVLADIVARNNSCLIACCSYDPQSAGYVLNDYYNEQPDEMLARAPMLYIHHLLDSTERKQTQTKAEKLLLACKDDIRKLFNEDSYETVSFFQLMHRFQSLEDAPLTVDIDTLLEFAEKRGGTKPSNEVGLSNAAGPV